MIKVVIRNRKSIQRGNLIKNRKKLKSTSKIEKYRSKSMT